MAAASKDSVSVNNEVYNRLGDRWYSAEDDPIALLRAESRLRNPWIARELAQLVGEGPARVLDVGCGGGFLSNYLAALGHHVTGIDASPDALAIARRYDTTALVSYRVANALELPFAAASFDAVCAMDFLEHVEDPDRVIAEAARVLKPSGMFFFHTFNRTFLSWLVVIKGVEWFVRNTPRNLHILRLFLKPEEIDAACARHGLVTAPMRGIRPQLGAAFFKMLLTRRVSKDFSFVFTSSTGLGFSGAATKSRTPLSGATLEPRAVPDAADTATWASEIPRRHTT
jgi:2-polyprenyl-6-hydroxyphenyl methylase/3-demethylubiquinone-9 3-methyltransferase